MLYKFNMFIILATLALSAVVEGIVNTSSGIQRKSEEVDDGGNHTKPRASTTIEPTVDDIPPRNEDEECFVPYLLYGKYTVHFTSTLLLAKDAYPGQAFDQFQLEATCRPGYVVEGNKTVSCLYGNWTGEMPQCVPDRTEDEEWTVGANGYSAYREQFPWHAVIYNKTTKPFMQICEGSLVSTTVVISAAHCFWNDMEEKLPAANYVVAVGKLYRSWNDPVDEGIQKSDVKEIKLPPRFQGNSASYQEDIAVVVMTSPFIYSDFVQPVCLNFDYEFDKIQLQEDSFGMEAGWSLTEKGVLDLLNVDIGKCISKSPPEFKSYITSDKIYAGYENGFCKLDKHPSVNYSCPVLENNFHFGSRVCNDLEPSGTIVRPHCNSNYYYPGPLPKMKCVDGNWNYVAVCNAECGRMTDDERTVGAYGYSAYRGQFPWHAGIYKKTTTPYMQICGGSLVSTTVVISAAHCFWSDVEKKLPAANFAVAVGKLYRPWNDPMDEGVQKSDVKEIKLPPRFQGNSASYQEDIAVMVMTSPFVYTSLVEPVCLNFDYEFDKKQLQEDSFGMVVGWGITEKGVPAPVLTVLELPVVDIEKCISKSPPEFKPYITSDKICAGYENGTALCRGDSGGGFAVSNLDDFPPRYYLRGIVSSAPKDDTFCNIYTFTGLTHVFKHEHFIKENL